MRRIPGRLSNDGLELGVNFFDTAVGYQSGTSEQYLGRALRDFAKREDVVVATKFLPRTQEEIAAGITGGQHIEQMVNTSLKNLGLDYIDLYIYHMWDYETPLYDIMEGLDRSGTGWQGAVYRHLQLLSPISWPRPTPWRKRRGLPKFVSIQGHYNLIFREEEREMARLCAEDNIAMTPYSALAGGRLSKHPGETSRRLEEDSYAKFKYDATAEQDAVILSRVAELAEKRGVSMTEISLAWLLTKVSAPVVGATKPHHMEGRGQSCGTCPDAGRMRLSGGTLCSPQAGGGHGPEHAGGRKAAARMVYGESENRTGIRRIRP